MSIGYDKDYVGSCINIASRLQKLGQLSFAFKRTGLDPQLCFSKSNARQFVTKRVNIRGIGEDKLIVVGRKDYEGLPANEKKRFHEP